MKSLFDVTDTAQHEAWVRGWNLWKIRRVYPGNFKDIYSRNVLAAVLNRLHWPLEDIADALGYPTDDACQFGITEGNTKGGVD